jgi:hypothetical protein
MISCFCYFKDEISELNLIKSYDSFEKVGSFLISMGSTFIGFLLTIITVITTFKKSFEAEHIIVKTQEVDLSEIPDQSFLNKNPISKEQQFYGSPIHKKVIDIFIYGAFEIGLALFSLVIIQMGFTIFSEYINTIVIICAFALISLTSLRTFYIFTLFLNVHVHDKAIK